MRRAQAVVMGAEAEKAKVKETKVSKENQEKLFMIIEHPNFFLMSDTPREQIFKKIGIESRSFVTQEDAYQDLKKERIKRRQLTVYDEFGSEFKRLAQAILPLKDDTAFQKVIAEHQGSSKWQNSGPNDEHFQNFMRHLARGFEFEGMQVIKDVTVYRSCTTTADGELELHQFSMPQSSSASKDWTLEYHKKTNCLGEKRKLVEFKVKVGVPLLPTIPLLVVATVDQINEVEVLLPILDHYSTEWSNDKSLCTIRTKASCCVIS